MDGDNSVTKISDEFYRSPCILKPLSEGQRNLLESIKQNHVTICCGAAGTGKTHITIAQAIRALQAKEVNKLIITRPVVESGRSIGYLPGTIADKIHPYMLPVMDILHDILGKELVKFLNEEHKLECAPLAYMRGRTFNQSYMLLDEAQNATIGEVKMFLSRIGHGSRAVICGDPAQSDLDCANGLAFCSCLQSVTGVGFTDLKKSEIVRNPIIAPILERFEEAETAGDNSNGRRNRHWVHP